MTLALALASASKTCNQKNRETERKRERDLYEYIHTYICLYGLKVESLKMFGTTYEQFYHK